MRVYLVLRNGKPKHAFTSRALAERSIGGRYPTEYTIEALDIVGDKCGHSGCSGTVNDFTCTHCRSY